MLLKEAVLELLEQNRERSLSGQKMAAELSVTRAAIWKAVEDLRHDGHDIEAVTNRGYRLSPNSDVLSEAGLRAHLTDPCQMVPIYLYKSIDSTNTQAKRLVLDGAEDCFIVLAEEQTAGRGYPAGRFFSPAGTGLYMSLVAQPHLELKHAHEAIIAALVAICRSIEDFTALSPQIQWPNGIFIGEKKVAGLLTEGEFMGTTVRSLIIGIGMHFRTPQHDFPAVIRDQVISLEPKQLTRNEMAASILNYMYAMQNGAYTNLLEDYTLRSLARGSELSSLDDGATSQSRAIAVDQHDYYLRDNTYRA